MTPFLWFCAGFVACLLLDVSLMLLLFWRFSRSQSGVRRMIR